MHPVIVEQREERNPAQFDRIASVGRGYVVYSLLAVVLLLTFAVRFHLRNLPLERDEGEYAYAGQLMLQGIPPYKLAYNMKLPGTYAAYAVILALFGQTAAGVHLGLLAVNLITIVLIFLLAKRVAGELAALASAAACSLLSLGPSVLGFAGHATHFVVMLALAGVLLLLEAVDRNRLWLFCASGAAFGFAFLMKQPGLMFAIFGGLYIVASAPSKELNWRSLGQKLATFSAGVVLPFAITCFWLWRAGVFCTFWFWTFSYAAQYATNQSLADGIHQLAIVLPSVVGPCLWLWLIAAAGLAATFLDRELRSKRLFVAGFLLFSFLAVCPDFLFREHYFILLLPAVSLCIAIAVSAGTRMLRGKSQLRLAHYLPAAAFVLAMAAAFYVQSDFFFEADPTAACRRIYGGNPFPEAIPIADYIRQHTPENATVAVLGSEPEIYFYAHRHSATGYIYTYGLMEEQKYALNMQQQMVEEIQSARPQALVLVNVSTSWLPRPHSQTLIYSWAQRYIQDNYDLSGVADIHMAQTDYRWGEDAKTFQPRSSAVVFIFQRKN